MNDYIDEELAIMEEQDAEKTISSDIFYQKIEEFPLHVPICVDWKSTLGEVIGIMQENGFGSVLVTKEKKLAGIITERDILLKVIGLIENWKEVPVHQVMTKDPITLRVDDMVVYVLHNMHVGGFRHIPIVNENHEPINMISIKDAVSFILDFFPDEISNLTSEPFRGNSVRESA